jgi:hypothetical protein
MKFKFLKCKNPNTNHIKLVYGEMINHFSELCCDCGYHFDEFVEIPFSNLEAKTETVDVLDYFNCVDPKEETKRFPPLE